MHALYGRQVLNAICVQYGVGDADPREPNSYLKVPTTSTRIPSYAPPGRPPTPHQDAPPPFWWQELQLGEDYVGVSAAVWAVLTKRYGGGLEHR